MKAKLDQAEEYFDKAKEELCKPEEDVVPYSICQSSYHAVVNYLSSFLIDNGATIPESENVESLLANCRELDQKFKKLHLVPMYNPTQSEDVWMNLDAAHDYLKMADNTRQMVRQI
ncbi:MAG: HEPN domain-containing protein [Cyclobacteriaceae bacterium]